MPEMSAVELADVLAIEPCPEIEDGPGGLVTSTFEHTAGEVLNLKVASESEPFGVTPTHPIKSEDRNDFVAAGDLHIGEQLETLDGTTVVESIVRRPEPETVYNIEVEGDHVYRVGESGVLVHNASNPAKLYRGDKSGKKATGFDSFESRDKGRNTAMVNVLNLSSDDLNKKMEGHATSKFLSTFVSTTSDIRVACYFATDACSEDGSIYVLQFSSLAKYNSFNTTQITLCDGKTIVGESEWLWFAYIDPKYIADEIPVTPDDCKCM